MSLAVRLTKDVTNRSQGISISQGTTDVLTCVCILLSGRTSNLPSQWLLFNSFPFKLSISHENDLYWGMGEQGRVRKINWEIAKLRGRGILIL